MAGQTVDFNAIAKQFGGVSAPPANAPSGPIDYAAIAKQNGATSSTPAPEKPGALARFGSGLYDTTVGPVVNTIAHPIDAAAGLFNVPKMQEIAKHIQDGDYGKAALAIGQFATENPANRMATQMVGDVTHDVKEGNLAGAGGRVLGDTLMLAGPKLGEVAAGSKAATAIGGAVRVATQPEVWRAGVKVLPKGPAVVSLVDKFQQAQAEASAATARANALKQPPRAAPAWADLPEPPVPSAPEFTSAQPPMGMDAEGNMRPGPLPSGRRVGPAPPVAQAPAPAARTPLWQGLTQSSEVAAPEFSSSPGSLPSGRVPGTGEPRVGTAPVETAPTAPAGPSAQLLDDIARGQSKKPFASLNQAQQEMVRALAQRVMAAESAAPVPAAPPPPVPALQQFEELKAQLPQAETPAATAPAPPTAPLAKDVAQQLYDEMKRGGTPVDAPPEPEEVNPFEAKARAKKVDTLASALNDAGQGYSRMSQLSGPELASTLQASAKMLGLKEFSGESISAVMSKLQELEAAKTAQPTAMQEFQAIKAKKTNGNGKRK